MKRSLYLLLCIILAVTVVLVSCGDDPAEEVHTHTYSEDWSFDDTNHWYAADCGCENEKSNIAPHEDADNDSVCDVCSWDYDHEHTYASNWSSDEESHWHVVTCNCSIPVGSKDSHSDKDNDGVCDVCAYDVHGGKGHTFSVDWSHNETNHWHDVTCGHNVDVVENPASSYGVHVDTQNDGVCDDCGWDYDHTHTFADKWSSNAEKHWYAVTCGHNVAAKDEAAHVDKNNDGDCDVCAYVSCVHTYDEETWAFDTENHWHGTTCGHNVTKDVAKHADANNDKRCDVCGYDYNHTEHTYETEWTTSEYKHWHKATCGCTVISDEAEHVDENNDGVCDVCLYVSCEHLEFTDAWNFDKENHWHKLACGHDVDLSEVAAAAFGAHVDENNDSVCDVCAWDYDHVHTYSTDLSYNLKSHFYAVTCGHDVANKDVVDHVDGDTDGKCDDCGGYISVAAFIDAVIASKELGLVSSGTVAYQLYDWDIETYSYYFGKDYLVIKAPYNDNYFSLFENADGQNVVFAVTVSDSESARLSYDDISAVEGYAFSVFWGDIAGYGVENFIVALDEYSSTRPQYGYVADSAKAYLNPVMADITFEKADGLVAVDVCYVSYLLYNADESSSARLVDITFALDENGVVRFFDANMSEYLEGTFTVDEDAKTYSFVENAAAETTYKYSVTQAIGERTDDENPYAPEELLIPELYLDADTDGDSVPDTQVNDGAYLDVMIGYFNRVELFFDESVADKAIFNEFETLVYLVTPEGEVEASYSEFTATYQSNEWTTGIPAIALQASNPGTYKVVIYNELTSITVTAFAKYAPTTAIDPSIMIDEYESTVSNTAEVYKNSDLIFSSSVLNGQNPAFEATLVSGDATKVTLTDIGDNQYSFTATVAGEYQIKLVSKSNSTVSSVLTVTVVEPPSYADILNGAYAFKDWSVNYEVTFTPASEGATNGTVVIVESMSEMSETFTYTCNELGEITLEHFAGDELGVNIFVRDYELYISYLAYGWMDAEEVLRPVVIANNGSGTIDDPFVLSAPGEYAAEYQGMDPIVYSFTAAFDGMIKVTFSGDNHLFFVGEFFNGDFYEESVCTINISAGQEYIFCIAPSDGYDPIEIPFTFEVVYNVETSTNGLDATDISANGTFNATVAAGETVYFQVAPAIDGEQVFEVTVSYTSEGNIVYYNTQVFMGQVQLFEYGDNSYFTYVNMNMPVYLFAIENTGAENASIEITVSIAEMEF